VILVYDHVGESYPTEDQFFATVQERCFPAFAAYTGSELLEQETLDIYWIYPQEEGWDSGDHEVVCSAYRLDDGTMTQSVKGTNPT
jgi:hypothetical protein